MRHLFSLALLLVWLCTPVHAEEAKEVLLLNSYHPGYAWNVELLRGMMKVFDRADIPLHLRYEYMDAKFDTTDAFVKELRQLYSQKYRNIRFNVVIASDDDAFHLARRYRDELFPGAAVVFCGVNAFSLHYLKDLKGFTGTAEVSDMEGTLRIALKLHPGTKHVALVGGIDRASRSNVTKAKSILQERFPEQQVLDFSGLDMEDVREKLRSAPRNTIVLYISYFLTPDGTRLSPTESIQVVGEAGLPMYSAWTYQLRDGIIGGQMLRGDDQGEIAARIAMRILHGEHADDIPVLTTSKTYAMFDGHQLDHFGVDRSLLPPRSIVLNEEQSVFQQYRGVIILTLLFIAYQTCVIFWLMSSIRRRKKAEASWQREQHARREAEVQLIHSQKLEAINTFAGGIAHDFNNILTAIAGCCEMAMEELPHGSVCRTDMQHALDATKRGRSIISRLLEFSRQTPQADMEPVDMRELTVATLDMLRPLLPPQVVVQQTVPPELPQVLGNGDQLSQILMNLCINAGQAMQDQKSGAVLTVELSTKEEDGKPWVCLVVRDTGPGIPPAVQSRIFDPFFTTKAKGMGTGLGLAVTRGLVHSHGGRLGVENAPEGGAVFTVLLPVAAGAVNKS